MKGYELQVAIRAIEYETALVTVVQLAPRVSARDGASALPDDSD